MQFRNEIFHDVAAVIWKKMLSGVYIEESGFEVSIRSRYRGEDVDEGHVRPSTTRAVCSSSRKTHTA